MILLATTSAPPPPIPTAPTAIERWLSIPILDNPLSAWLMAVLVIALIYFGFRIAKDVVVRRLRRFNERYLTQLNHLPDKLLADVRRWCILALAVYAGSKILALPTSANSAIKLVFIVAASLQVLITSRIVIDHVIAEVLSKAKQEDGRPDPSIASASQIMRFMAQIVLVTVLVLLALANLGVEITPLITGLGIGGIAVALAAQSVLSDLFGSLTILFDKPFLVGDFIVVGDKMGTVETIGVKTTRIRALSGELLIIANSDLLSSRIQNFKRLTERRVMFAIGVVYETPIEQVERIPGMLREIVTAREHVRLDRAHFKSFGAYSLDFEVVYYVRSPEFNNYMDIQQTVNLEIMRRFAKEKIEFAYPTTVEIHRGEIRTSVRPVRHEDANTGYAAGDERP